MATYLGDMMDDLNDLLMGGMDDDTLNGLKGNDTLEGGGGDDRLIGGPGADVLVGGDGMDTADYIRSNMGVYVDIGSLFNIDDDDKPPIHSGHAEGDQITEVENIFGSKFGDILRGNHQANRLFGWRGDDIISGRDGGDYLRGESGADLVMGGPGNDMVFGDMGNDALHGDSGTDMVWGGKGNDILYGGVGDDTLEGGAGGDEIDGGGYTVNSLGTEMRLPGDDTDVDIAAYTMSPEAVIINLSNVDMSDGTIRNPALGPYAKGGHADDDSYISIEGVTGSAHDDMLTGDSGANWIRGGDGADMITGGFATDMGDFLFGGMGDDTILGGGGKDSISGNEGDDSIQGQDGDDTLTGGPGADKLYGGSIVDPDTGEHEDAGTDTASYARSPEAVKINLNAKSISTGLTVPTAEGGDAEGDMLKGIENLTGSDHADLLIGADSESNVLMGGKGDDWDNPFTTRVKEGGLFGMSGNDTLSGGAGMDWLDGGEGDDDLWGGSGNDLIKGGAGNDISQRLARAEASADGTLAADVSTADNTLFFDNDGSGAGTVTEGDTVGVAVTYANVKAVPVKDGGAVVAADGTVTTAASFVRAGLYGGAGNDTLMGGAGADYIDGGTGSDTASYADDNVGVTVVLAADGSAMGTGPAASDPTPASEALGDVLKSIENLTGGDGGDMLTGNARANILEGGAGNDTLTGGAGADVFVFGEQTSATDTIMDFSSSQGDKIDISALGLTAADLHVLLTDAATVVVDGTTGIATYRLRAFEDDPADATVGVDAGAGTIVVTMAEAFGTLTAADFILG